MSKIKDCPWCGNDGMLVRFPAYCCSMKDIPEINNYYVQCRVCGATAPGASFSDAYYTPEQATEKAIEK